MSAEQIKRLVAEFGKARFAVGDSGQGHGAAEAAYARVCAAIDAALPGVQPYSEMTREQLERHAARMAQALKDDKPLTFWQRYARQPMMAPSCLVCGQLPEKVAITHGDLPGIVVCEKCVNGGRAERASPQAVPYNRAREMAEEVMNELHLSEHGWNEDDVDRIQSTLLPRVYDCLNLLAMAAPQAVDAPAAPALSVVEERKRFDCWYDDPPDDGPTPEGPISRESAWWIWTSALYASQERPNEGGTDVSR
jgi:hypothetical protein